MFFGIIVPKKLELYLFFGTIVSGSVGPQNGYGGMVGLQNLSRGTGGLATYTSGKLRNS